MDPPPKRIAVIAMDQRRLVRETFETQLLNRLADRQVGGFITATNVALDELKGDTTPLRQKLLNDQAEAALITRLADKSSAAVGPRLEQISFMDPGLTWMDIDNARMSWYGSGSDIATTLVLESRLYRLRDGALLWVGHSATVLKESTDGLERLRTMAKMIVNRMAKDGVIP